MSWGHVDWGAIPLVASDQPEDASCANDQDIVPWLAEGPRPLMERVRLPLAFAAALALHIGLGAAGYLTPSDSRLGTDRLTDVTISVQLISVDQLRRRNNRDPDATKTSPIQPRTTAKAGAAIGEGAAARDAEASSQMVDSTAVLAKTVATTTPAKPDTTTADPTQLALLRLPQPKREDNKSASDSSRGSEAADREVAGGGAALAKAAIKGRIARGYDARLIKALAPLEQHLRAANTARKSRSVGRVELSLTINAQGRAERVVVARSSGDKALDTIAVADIEAFRFPPPPSSLSSAARTYRLPITYR